MIVALAHFTDRPRENPYVWRLGSALIRQGLDVRPLPASALFLLRYAAARDATTIHFQWFETQVGAASLLKILVKSSVFLFQLKICKWLGKHLVWTVHNTKSHEVRFSGLERWVVRTMASTVDEIIIHCGESKASVVGQLGRGSGDKMSVVPHGNYIGLYETGISRQAARARLDINDEDTVILFLGAIRPYKGVDQLITAFGELERPNAKLLVVGKPMNSKMAEDIQQQCSAIPNAEFVPGFVADDDMQVYFGAADVVAFPYHDILMSGAVILAMSFGKACIAPRIGCLPAVLSESANFLYSPDSADALRNALDAAIDNQASTTDCGQQNMAMAKRLDWDDIAGKTARLYR